MTLDTENRVYASIDVGAPVMCQWFALCDHLANGLREHPVLGQVPICARCDDKTERMSA